MSSTPVVNGVYQFSVNQSVSLRTETENLLQIVVAVCRRRQYLVRGRAGHGVSVLVDLHTQAQAHRGKDLLDFVQRLASEVFRLQHFGFGFLHQLADRLNVRVLQAVIATNGKFELLDRTVEVLVLNFRPALFARGRGLDLFFEVDEDVHVIFNQLRGESERIARGDRTVGPDFDRQLVVVGDLSKTRRLDGVVTFPYWRVHGIDGNESNSEVVFEIAVGRNVAAAALQTHFHVELAAFAHG